MSMKLKKTTAGVTAPTGTTPGVLGVVGASVNSVIVIGFGEFEAYGKLNGAWQLMGASVSPDAETASANQEENVDLYADTLTVRARELNTKPAQTAIDLTSYEDVYFVSKTGEEQVIRFFEVQDTVVAPNIIDKATGLSDIADMPAFTAADAGKVLSVDNQGNLVWINR